MNHLHPQTIHQRRCYPIGAEVRADGTHFRLWAPRAREVEVVIESPSVTARLNHEERGYFSAMLEGVGPDALYRFRLDGAAQLLPDPASRFQPEGPHGPSRIVDPRIFNWAGKFKGLSSQGQVIYELHPGTFTPEGSWRSAIDKLPHLAELGITVIELMPIAEFSGRFGWGYDGVSLFAPSHLYGEPDDLRLFIDRAHQMGMGVILDVVYNHLGPDGNYLRHYSVDYFTDRYQTDWGEAVNLDGENSGPVREFFLTNAAYWIQEFQLDGVRLDATQAIYDSSKEHLLAALTKTVRMAGGDRSTFIVAENEPQDTRLVMSCELGGYGADTLWNDDFHHSATVALTGKNEAYYTDYLGTPQELISAIKWGYLFQGQWYKWQGKRRGRPALHLEPFCFVNFIENHDQIANSGGFRCHRKTTPGRFRAMTALLLLAPQTPMLFQGQEFAASSPFLYFADHTEELADQVRQGRRKFLAQFRSFSTPEMQARLTDPADPANYEESKLKWEEKEQNKPVYRLHRDLLKIRRNDPVFQEQRRRCVDGAVLGIEAFVLRFFGEKGDDRLLVINLGRDLHLDPAPEPLLAPPQQNGWRILWSSEDPEYGGTGTPPLDTRQNWRLPGHAAVVLAPRGHTEWRK